MTTNQVFLGLGTNIGDRLNNLMAAIFRISFLPDTEVKKYSSVYETEPVGHVEQDNFLNMVVEVSTDWAPEPFFREMQEIEKSLGRVKKIKKGPRVIDIDILFWGSEILNTNDLQIPHPEVQNRKFVLVPLHEIAPKFKTPHRSQEIGELLKNVKDDGWVELFVEKGKLELKI